MLVAHAQPAGELLHFQGILSFPRRQPANNRLLSAPRHLSDKILKAAQSNTIRLNRLIEEILDFQKLENNKLKLNISYGDISSDVYKRQTESI